MFRIFVLRKWQFHNIACHRKDYLVIFFLKTLLYHNVIQILRAAMLQMSVFQTRWIPSKICVRLWYVTTELCELMAWVSAKGQRSWVRPSESDKLSPGLWKWWVHGWQCFHSTNVCELSGILGPCCALP